MPRLCVNVFIKIRVKIIKGGKTLKFLSTRPITIRSYTPVVNIYRDTFVMGIKKKQQTVVDS